MVTCNFITKVPFVSTTEVLAFWDFGISTFQELRQVFVITTNLIYCVNCDFLVFVVNHGFTVIVPKSRIVVCLESSVNFCITSCESRQNSCGEANSKEQNSY